MFGWNENRRHKAERVVGQAWDHLTSTVDSATAGTRSARRRAGHFVNDTSATVSSTSREARRRAQDAYGALTGRRNHGTSWGWVVAASMTGLAAGWAATTLVRRRREESLALDTAEIFSDLQPLR